MENIESIEKMKHDVSQIKNLDLLERRLSNISFDIAYHRPSMFTMIEIQIITGRVLEILNKVKES